MKRRSGAFSVSARSRLDTEALDNADRAHLDLIQARILFTVGGSGETVVLLSKAAKRLEAVSADAARATYLHAFSAGSFLGREVTIDQWLDLGRAAAAAPPPVGPSGAGDMLLDGLALQLTAGYAPSLAPLRRALETFSSDGEHAGNLVKFYGWHAASPSSSGMTSPGTDSQRSS